MTAVSVRSSRSLLQSITYAAWAVLIILLLAFAIDAMVQMPRRDQGAFIYVAQGILDGQVPYLDRWDHKGPLIYLLNVVGLALGGIPGIWLVGSAFLLGAAWLVFKILRESFGLVAALFSIALFLILFSKFGRGGNFTEHYALLFQLLAVFLFLRVGTGDARRDTGLAIAIGALGAAAFLLRADLVGVWLAVGIYWLTRGRAGPRWIMWSVVGGSAGLLFACLVFALVGGLGAFWDAYIVYNLVYIDSSFADRLAAVRDLAGELNLLTALLIASWCVGLSYRLTRRKRSRRVEDLLSLALVLAPIEVVLISLSGFQWTHYYLAILPVAALLTGFITWLVIERELVSPTFLAAAVLLALLYGERPDRGLPDLVDKYRNTEQLTTSRWQPLAWRVGHETGPGDLILVWGADAAIYLLSERDAPTRFFYQYPLVKPGYGDLTRLNEFFSDVIAGRPRVIVDTYNNRMPPLDQAKRRDWRPNDKRYLHDPKAFRLFLEYVRTEYHPIANVGGKTIYKDKDRP